MSAGPDPRPASPSGLRVRVLSDAIEVACPAIFSRSAAGPIAHFLRETSALPRVDSVEVDLDAGLARVRFQPGKVDPRRLAGELAAHLRRPVAAPGAGDLSPEAVESLSREGKFQVHRIADVVTDLELIHDLPGRLRVRHPHVKGDPTLARAIEAELRQLPGVTQVEARSRTGSVLVYYDPQRLSKADLLRAAGRSVHKPTRRPTAPTVAALVPHTASLGAATVAEFAAPALMPAAGAVFVAANWRSLVNGSKELLTLRPRLDGLGTAITTLSIINGSFFAASAMLWLIHFWRLKHEWDRTAARGRLLESLAVPAPEQEPERLPAQLAGRPASTDGALVRLASGDRVPVDGEVCGGAAAVDERALTGRTGIVRRAFGDRLLAGSTILDGGVVVRPTATGAETRAAGLLRELEGALRAGAHPNAYTARSEGAAATMVVPAFALAGAGLAVGGLGTALAVLRPDYASGIGTADSFERIRIIGTHLQGGVLVRRPEALGRLRSAHVVLIAAGCAPRSRSVVHQIDCYGSWTSATLVALIARTGRYFGDEVAGAIRAVDRATDLGAVPIAFDHGVTFWDGHSTVRVEYAPGAPGYHALTVTCDGTIVGRIGITPADEPAVAELVSALKRHRRVAVGFVGGDRRELLRAGADFVMPDVPDEELGTQLEQWGETGRRIVFVGDPRAYPHAACSAEVSVNFAGLEHPATGDLVLLSGTWDALPELWPEARRGRFRRAMTYGLSWGPNAACVAAGFAFGVPLVSVALSNFGTLAAYSWAHRRVSPEPHAPALLRVGAGLDRPSLSTPDVRAPPAARARGAEGWGYRGGGLANGHTGPEPNPHHTGAETPNSAGVLS